MFLVRDLTKEKSFCGVSHHRTRVHKLDVGGSGAHKGTTGSTTDEEGIDISLIRRPGLQQQQVRHQMACVAKSNEENSPHHKAQTG